MTVVIASSLMVGSPGRGLPAATHRNLGPEANNCQCDTAIRLFGKPGEIPFEQGTKLELVVNLRGARALGITIPKSVLLSADEVIE